MSEFKPGDKVLVNGNVVATIDFYDPSIDVLRYVSAAGTQTDTVTASVVQTRLELLEAAEVEEPATEESE